MKKKGKIFAEGISREICNVVPRVLSLYLGRVGELAHISWPTICTVGGYAE